MSKKYARTPHLPFSKGATSDDKIAKDISSILNKDILILDKMDGSNASLEKEACYARSHNGPPTHPSFDMLKSLHGNVGYKLPDNLQIFGEELYALHSIKYYELPHHFMVFATRSFPRLLVEGRQLNYDHGSWGSWETVESWAKYIGVPTVPILWRGKVKSEKELQNLTEDLMKTIPLYSDVREGLVIRNADEFEDKNFPLNVFKFVRQGHVNINDDHWMHKEIVKNGLALTDKDK